jgi:hypothetical protein
MTEQSYDTDVAMSEQQLAEAIIDYLVKHRLVVPGPGRVQIRLPTTPAATLWITMVVPESYLKEKSEASK